MKVFDMNVRTIYGMSAGGGGHSALAYWHTAKSFQSQ